MAKNKAILQPIKEIAKSIDLPMVNEVLKETELADFEMNKSTITNIAEWCLNGETDNEIRQRLSLNKNQWAILVNVCPTLLLIMKESRAIADVVIAGSLFQTAIGGKRIKKQQPVKVKDFPLFMLPANPSKKLLVSNLMCNIIPRFGVIVRN